MVRYVFAALLLTACQPQPPADSESDRSEGGEINQHVAQGNSDLIGSSPDAPVSSDDPPPPADVIKDGNCPIIRSDDWQAHVDAMPGPNRRPQLIVSGSVTVPTGGFKLALRMGPVAESYPVQVTVLLDAIPPRGAATQALETREVRGVWPSEERVGSVTVRCGDRVVARLSNVETAR